LNWREAIAKLIRLHQHIRDMDAESMWANELPGVPAKPEDILRAEQSLGVGIDGRFREFLSCANGWRAFYQWVDLFGTHELTGEPMRRAEKRLNELAQTGVLSRSGLSQGDVLPIAMTRDGQGAAVPDLFCIVRPPNPSAGTVVWFSDEEIDRFSSYDEFYLAMLDYNREEIRDLSKEARDQKRTM
jgi:hypothetical protein